MSPRLAWAALAVALVVHAATAQAQEPGGRDYDLANSDWRGLSTLGALAEGMGWDVVQVSGMDWDDIQRDDVLILLYPVYKLEPTHLASFVRNGGRALIADDFGKSDEALAALNILRGPGSAVKAASYWDQQSFAPIAEPLIEHPLTSGVEELVTNYPAVWRMVRGPQAVFGFADSGVLVAAIEQHDGRLIALSDPSVLINRMVEFPGNFQFALNTLEWLSRPDETRRLVIMSGELNMYGKPTRILGDDHRSGTVGGVLEGFNRWLDQLEEWQPMPEGLRVIAVAVALILALVAVLALPRLSRPRLDGAWTRARGGPDVIEPEQLIMQLEAGGRGASFTLPAAIMRDSLNQRLAALLGAPDPLYTVPEPSLLKQVGNIAGPGGQRALAAIYPRLRALPTRAQAASVWQAPHTSQRDFERMSAAVEQLYRTLGDRS